MCVSVRGDDDDDRNDDIEDSRCVVQNAIHTHTHIMEIARMPLNEKPEIRTRVPCRVWTMFSRMLDLAERMMLYSYCINDCKRETDHFT